MIFMLDNYDSFTYNLVQDLAQQTEVVVYRNNKITVEEVEKLDPDGIVISPGPGRPCDAGISIALIKHFAGKKPILGVCLGHQAIAEAFGGVIVHAGCIMHGKTSNISHDGKGVFAGLKDSVQVMRYHSLAADRNQLPACLEVTATTDDGEIMGLRHKEYMIEGVQFHPESIMTPLGKKMLRNFINQCESQCQTQKTD